MGRVMELSASQEDYLEAILRLIRQTGNARVRDIAKRLNVAKSSVTSALRALARRELVDYKPYQLVSLTARGEAMAERILVRHKVLSNFFTGVLDVDRETADAHACRIEHAVGDGMMQRLSCFVGFLSSSEVPARELPEAFRRHCADRRDLEDCAGCGADEKEAEEPSVAGQREGRLTLDRLVPGEKGKVLRLGRAAAANQRLAEMGMTRGVVVEVLRVAPLGDPVEIRVRGYNLSLRKGEAAAVEVERIKR